MTVLREVVKEKLAVEQTPPHLARTLLSLYYALTGNAGDKVVDVSRVETINETKEKIKVITGK